MIRTIETDTTTSRSLESSNLIDWLETEDWQNIFTESWELIYVNQLITNWDKETDITTSIRILENNTVRYLEDNTVRKLEQWITSWIYSL